MMRPWLCRSTLSVALLLQTTSLCFSQIATDGSLGAATTLSGPNYQIDANLGSIQGGNLFHSFDRFSLSAGESARFTGPAAINNIISRVTGGEVSHIDGLIQDDFSSVNFYFINPAGVMLGPSASLNVSGSFHISTADYIRLSDGGRYMARIPGEDVTLSSAPPVAFGFLDSDIASITIEGSNLIVGENNNIAIVGGDIVISETLLAAPQGRILVAGISETQDMVIEGTGLDEQPALNDSDIQLSNSTLNTNGFDGGGDISLYGGHLSVTDSFILSYSVGNNDAGALNIRGNSIQLAGSTFIDTGSYGGESEAVGGNILLQAESTISIYDGTFIQSPTYSTGNAGNITLTANSLEASGAASIDSSSLGQGNAGDIFIHSSGSIELHNAARIKSVAFAGGNSGSITVTTEDTLLISNSSPTEIPSGLYTTAEEGASGNAGDIFVSANNIFLENGAYIVSSVNAGMGDAGNIQLAVTDSLQIMGNSEAGDGGVIESAVVQGNAGGISIDANTVDIFDGGLINATTLGPGRAGHIAINANHITVRGIDATSDLFPSSILAVTAGDGDGGDITLNTSRISLADKGQILTNSCVPGLCGSGLAGNIRIEASDWIHLDSGATIAAAAEQTDGGNITLNASSRLWLKDASITTSVGSGDGSGGNINIDPDFVILDNSTIEANAFGGSGGNIMLSADQFISSPDSRVEAIAKAGPGIDGTVVIDSPDRDIRSRLSRHKLTFSHDKLELSNACKAPSGDQLISLTLLSKHAPIALLPQSMRTPSLPHSIKDVATTTSTRNAPHDVDVTCQPYQLTFTERNPNNENTYTPIQTP